MPEIMHGFLLPVLSTIKEIMNADVMLAQMGRVASQIAALV